MAATQAEVLPAVEWLAGTAPLPQFCVEPCSRDPLSHRIHRWMLSHINGQCSADERGQLADEVTQR